MDIYSEMMKDVEVPKFIQLKYDIGTQKIEDVKASILSELNKKGVMARVKKNARIAITAGSREIDQIVLILRTVADEVKKAGGVPFIVPSMGSHGGADADKQTKLLENFGITEETVGAPIFSSLETVLVGYTEDGLEVRIDKYAAEADGIIAIGRVKPHTSFRGKVESGLMKMLAIGLGKPFGAALCHQLGFENMGKNVWNFGNLILEKSKVLFGLAIVDNDIHQISLIEAIPSELIPEREPQLLEYAKSLIPKIPFENIDMLIVEEMGKEYSGTGMDTNVTGRNFQLGDSGLNPKRLAVFDLTDHSEGNAAGISGADVITQKFEDKIDRKSFYVNTITVREIEGLKLPAVMPNENLAIKLCLHTLLPEKNTSEIRAVWIRNTLNLNKIYVSEGLMEEASKIAKLEESGVLQEIEFDSFGNAINMWEE